MADVSLYAFVCRVGIYISKDISATDGDRAEIPVCGGELALGNVAAVHSFQPVEGQAFQIAQSFICFSTAQPHGTIYGMTRMMGEPVRGVFWSASVSMLSHGVMVVLPPESVLLSRSSAGLLDVGV